MKNFVRVTDKINQIIFNFLAILLGAVALLTLYQVFARYILNSPLTWSEEIIRSLMVWIVLLGTAIALRKGLLISVETVLHIVPKGIKLILNTIIIILNFVYMFLLLKYGIEIMQSLHGQTSGALDLPVNLSYAAIPAGALYSLINCLVVIIELISKDSKGDDTHDRPIIS
ncbi:TRAP transporter small permease [Chryseomicrobium palamuruense]|uniref:TRAP transporter small permease n=1 Tax=Chryseomicrobium palamuruense TaxID=682973 RepID=A0ABV8UWX9_9BACL